MRVILLYFLAVSLFSPEIGYAVKVKNLDNQPHDLTFINIGEKTRVTIDAGNMINIKGPSVVVKLGDQTIRSRPIEEYIIKNNKLHIQRANNRGYGR